MATFKISVLLLIKSWTFWYIERLPTSSYTGVTYFQKWSGFFWPTLYFMTSTVDFHVVVVVWTGLHACCCCWSKSDVSISQEPRRERLSVPSGSTTTVASDIVEADHGKQCGCYWLINWFTSSLICSYFTNCHSFSFVLFERLCGLVTRCVGYEADIAAIPG